MATTLPRIQAYVSEELPKWDSKLSIFQQNYTDRIMQHISLSIKGSWEEFEHLLQIRGDCKEPQLAFDNDRIGIDGCPELWNELVITFVSELMEEEEDLVDAIAAEEGSNQRIPWEVVKQELGLK